MEKTDSPPRNCFFCFMCQESILYMKIASHVPKCLRHYCITTMEILPHCSCNHCKGEKTHPGDHFGQVISLAPSLPPSTNSNRQGIPIPRGQTPILLDQDAIMIDVPSSTSLIQYSMKQSRGKHCILCGANRSPAQLNVPMIYVGNYR